MQESIRVGFVGYGWIARAHAHALHSLNHVDPPARPIALTAVAGRTRERLEPFARELGFARTTTRWEEVVAADDVDVVLVATPVEAHAEPVRAALAAGKHVLCEKPLAVDAFEARELADAAGGTGTTNATGFNYRYLPAIALAHRLAEDGRLGELRHYRALYLQDYQTLGTQTRPSHGGAGAILDYCHLVDMLRFLAGEPVAVLAQTARFVSAPGLPRSHSGRPYEPDGRAGGPARPEAAPQAWPSEDQFAAVLELRDGATATLEASRCALGWKGRHRVELNGSDGSLWWDMEDLNRLHVFFLEDERQGVGGFRDVLVTNPDHPFVAQWWPPGHVLGWEHALVHQWRDFLEAVLEARPVPPRQASFEDGWRAAVVSDAIHTSAREGRRIELDLAKAAAR